MTSAILDKPILVRSHALPARDYVEFLNRTGIDLAYLGVPWPVGRREAMDEEGRPYYLDGLIKERSDLSQVTPPSLEPVRRRIESFLEAAQQTRIGWVYALPAACGIESAVGYENYFVKIYDDPGFIEEFMDRYEAYTMSLTELVLSYRPDAVFLAAGICYKSGLVMNIQRIERLVFARLEKQMALIRRANIPAIIHSDGDNTPVMDRWIELGFSGFHPIEPCPNFDIYSVKKRWGDKIALIGGIDVASVLSMGNPELVAEAARAHITTLAAAGGYICGSSHDIVDSIPLDNVEAMVRTVTETRLASARYGFPG